MDRARSRGRYFIVPGIVLACLLPAWCHSAFALNPALDVNQYAHTSWKIRDGFFQSPIRAIAQTPDGYLWLGTESGLLRFDGIKPVPWQSPPDQHLPDNFIWSLLVGRDGTLWIGTSKGLASWKDGKLAEYPELAGQYVTKIFQDQEGTVWAGGLAVPTGRLCAIGNGGVQCYGTDGSLDRGIVNLYEDSKGSLWAGGERGLWRWKPGPPKFYPLPREPHGIWGLGEDADGAFLIGVYGGIHRFVDGKTEPYPLSDAMGKFQAMRLLCDRQGGFWIGTSDRGLIHGHQGRTDRFVPSDGLSGDNVYAIFEDREGNIWVATKDGLDRFRDYAVATFAVNQGLSNDLVTSVLADRDGGVWLGTGGGLNRWKNGQITIYREHTERTMTGVREIVGSGLPDKKVESLFQDDRGRIWVATDRGFGYLENDRFISISGVPGGETLSIAEDTAGSLWVANEGFGLFHLHGRSEVQQISWASLGHKDHASVLAADPVRGGLWLGFFLGGIAYWSHGQVRGSYTSADGLGAGHINYLRVDPDGTLWAATDGGLSRLKDGRIATLTSKDGLPCDAVHWAIEDDAHSFWMYTACGFVRIAQAEMAAWIAAVDQNVDQSKGAKRAIQATIFDSSDGVRGLAASIHYSPQVAKSADGKLWFLPLDGVSVVDPRHLPFNPVPPPVHIQRFVANHNTYDATSAVNGRVELPALIRNLEIDYTALSLVVPEKVLFRYMLEGKDSDWQEAGNRRQAFYNDLAPGNYRFRVLACNNSGVWSETGTFLDFSIAPAYYQTTWFRLSLAAAFLILLATLYQLRLRQVARQVQGRMEARLEERERIARDLHDTLLQSVQGLILKIHAVAMQMRRDEPARDALEKTLDRADEILAEGRDRVRNLRTNPIPFGGLPAAFQQVAEETLQGGDAVLQTVVEGHVLELHPLVREEAYCIGREALVNAFTHSNGKHIEVEITYDPRQFRLRVRDDGHGIDPKFLEKGGRADHWGLQGMRERAQKIGAQLKFWSRAETGTEIELIVPGATAYKAASDQLKSPRFSRLFRR